MLQIKNFIEDKKNLHIGITAHTDSIGSLADNMALSQRRSEAVRVALSEMGVADSLLSIHDFGETRPVTTNQTDEGRQRNRRATIKIVKYPPMVLLEGNVRDAKTGSGLAGMVVIRGKGWRDTLFTDTTGYFSKKLPLGIVVGVDAFAECYFFGTEMTKTTKRLPPLDILLNPIRTGQAITLNNLYFVGNQPVLLEKSKPELPKILRFMQSNPKLEIEVAGHVNVPNQPPVGERTGHFKLSEARAFTVFKYLTENGIPQSRISYRGYGNWEMVYPNAIEERKQAMNRRVELKVLESGCGQ